MQPNTIQDGKTKVKFMLREIRKKSCRKRVRNQLKSRIQNTAWKDYVYSCFWKLAFYIPYTYVIYVPSM